MKNRRVLSLGFFVFTGIFPLGVRAESVKVDSAAPSSAPAIPVPSAEGAIPPGTAGEPSAAVPQNAVHQNAVVPPRPLLTSVDYPTDGEGDSLVLLQFVVTSEGQVRDVEVLLGDEPFASAAEAAAITWKFQAAERGGRRVSARIQFEVRFSVQTPAAPDQAAPANGAKPPASRPGPAQAQAEAKPDESVEVLVVGERPPLATRLTAAEARQVPGALGDPIRAVELMPGVTPIVSGLPLFYLRGAPPGNISYFIDEVRVPFLYHAFLGPSVIHPELLESVTLYPGPYPVEYGEAAGGIVNAGLHNPRQDLRFGGELGLFDVGLFAETPFADGQGRLFAAGRYSYSALLASRLSNVKADFWNYQAFGEYRLTPEDKVGLFALGAYDLAQRPGSEAFEGYEFEFHRVDARYEHSFGADTKVKAGFTVGTDRTHLLDGRVSDLVLGGRLSAVHRFSDKAQLKAGVNFVRDSFDLKVNDLSINSEKARELFSTRVDSALAGYVGLDWRPERWFQVTPGVRVTQYRSGDESRVGVDPRLLSRVKITSAAAIVSGIGIAHQTPNYIPNVPGARVAGLDGGLQRSIFFSSGVELALPFHFAGVVSVFNNFTLGVTDPFSSTQDFALNPEAAKQRADGHSYGLEVKLQRPLTSRFGAFLAYTLSRTERAYDQFTTLAGSDRTHVLNLAGLYTLGANWRVGARGVAYSGVPGRLEGPTRIYDQSRADPFFRLDLRLERRFRFGPENYWSVVAEMQNVTLSKDTFRRTCKPASRISPEVVCQDSPQGGAVFLPNIKLEARF